MGEKGKGSTCSEATKGTLTEGAGERGKREFSCDQQVERSSDSPQLHAKGFVGRRRKWRYQKEIKIRSAAYL